MPTIKPYSADGTAAQKIIDNLCNWAHETDAACKLCKKPCLYGKRYMEICEINRQEEVSMNTARDKALLAEQLIRSGKNDGEAAVEAGYKNTSSMHSMLYQTLKTSPAQIRRSMKETAAPALTADAVELAEAASTTDEDPEEEYLRDFQDIKLLGTIPEFSINIMKKEISFTRSAMAALGNPERVDIMASNDGKRIAVRAGRTIKVSHNRMNSVELIRILREQYGFSGRYSGIVKGGTVIFNRT